jgi:hypothetical protein
MSRKPTGRSHGSGQACYRDHLKPVCEACRNYATAKRAKGRDRRFTLPLGKGGRPREPGPRGEDGELLTPDHGTVSLSREEADDILDADASLTDGRQREWRFVKGTRHRVAFVPDDRPDLNELLAMVSEYRRGQILEKLVMDEINEAEAVRMLRAETGPPRPKPVENPYDRAHMEM